MTNYGDMIDDDHWDDDDEDPADDEGEPLVELDTHTISIKDRVTDRVQCQDHVRYWDWRIALDGDRVVGWAVWEKNETHVDSVPSPAPEDVPALVKRTVAEEMGWDGFDSHLDVPAFYSEDRP